MLWAFLPTFVLCITQGVITYFVTKSGYLSFIFLLIAFFWFVFAAFVGNFILSKKVEKFYRMLSSSTNPQT